MTPRRSIVGTIVVAIIVAINVPVSQLRTSSTRIVTTCCCPDPSRCHCPDHKADHSGRSSIRACHRVTHESVAPQAPSFTTPQLALADLPVRIAPAAMPMPGAPHAPPVLARPDGPS